MCKYLASKMLIDLNHYDIQFRLLRLMTTELMLKSFVVSWKN